jgi:cell division protein FtsN
VLAEDLLFVGVVTLENKVPQKVVYRIDRIVNAPRAARDVLEMAEELAEIAPSERPESPSSPPTTQPSTTTPAATMPATQTSSGTSNEEGFRIQLGSFTLKNYAEDRKAEAEKAGFQVSIVETTGPDGDVVYKVLSSTYKVKAEAEASLAKFKAAGFEQSFLVRLPSK